MMNLRKLLQLEPAYTSTDSKAAASDAADDKLTQKVAELKAAEQQGLRDESKTTARSGRGLVRNQAPVTTKNMRHPGC